MKKLVVRLDLHDDRAKQKALKTVSSLQGIDSISMDMKEKKLTVIGSVDPVNVVSKLRKYWQTDIITVGPAKEPEKKEEPKKEEAKKEEPKKGEEPPKEEAKKDEEQQKSNGEPKKDEGSEKKEGGEKKDEPAKKEEEPKKPPQQLLQPYWHMPPHDPVMELARAYRAYNPYMTTHYYAQSMEENPNACIIC